MTDEELARFHAGEERFFRELVVAHSPRLLVVTRSFATAAQEAHDLLQETWLRAWARRRTYSGTGPILGWLYAVCRSVCISRTRKAGARMGSLELSVGSGGRSASPSGAGFVERQPAGPEPPDAALARMEARRAVRFALLELPERQRAVVLLRILEGRSTREAAEALGCAEGTVKAALHHALRRLEPLLCEWGPER
ncbi:MAG: RNA polymerase sigma factor [Gemmatimonadota bacterium]